MQVPSRRSVMMVIACAIILVALYGAAQIVIHAWFLIQLLAMTAVYAAALVAMTFMVRRIGATLGRIHESEDSQESLRRSVEILFADNNHRLGCLFVVTCISFIIAWNSQAPSLLPGSLPLIPGFATVSGWVSEFFWGKREVVTIASSGTWFWWASFLIYFFATLVYTPIAFSDEVKDAWDAATKKRAAPPASAPTPKSGKATTPAPQAMSTAGVLGWALAADFLVELLFRLIAKFTRGTTAPAS